MSPHALFSQSSFTGNKYVPFLVEMIKSGKKLPEMITGELNHEPFTYTDKQFRHMDSFIKYELQQAFCPMRSYHKRQLNYVTRPVPSKKRKLTLQW